jgi:biotin-(acetyl-CoA carboxylase) ligase
VIAMSRRRAVLPTTDPPRQDRLSIDAIRRSLTTETLGFWMWLLSDVASTTDALRRLADRGASEGTVVLAEGDRPVRDRAGGHVRVSVLLRPRTPEDVQVVGVVTALAMTDAMRSHGVAGRIDTSGHVVAHGETVGRCTTDVGDDARHAILGVEVNLDVDRNAFVAAFLNALERWWFTGRSHGAGPVLDEWRRRSGRTPRRGERGTMPGEPTARA